MKELANKVKENVKQQTPDVQFTQSNQNRKTTDMSKSESSQQRQTNTNIIKTNQFSNLWESVSKISQDISSPHQAQIAQLLDHQIDHAISLAINNIDRSLSAKKTCHAFLRETKLLVTTKCNRSHT